MLRCSLTVFFLLINAACFASVTFRGKVVDAETSDPLVGVVVTVNRQLETTDTNGEFVIVLNEVKKNQPVKLSRNGYETLTDTLLNGKTYELLMQSTSLQEVVVTATESKGITSSSKIGQHAMEHLQPSSFSDVLELLPGGMAQTPTLNTPNIIALREACTTPLSQYCTSSLGTLFMIDGSPLSTNANLQYVDGAWDTQTTYRDNTNAGVDMRSISTDDIESVEIVRGIPSAEYGELTSGLVKISRKKGGNNIAARFKADMSSKLLYVGKGWEWKPKKFSLNVSMDYLNSKADPRNIFETYKRLNGSVRLNKGWERDSTSLTSSLNLDYGGSFDDDKVDPDINYGGVDSYESSYNRMALDWSGELTNKRKFSLFRKAEAKLSLTNEKNLTSRTRLVQISRETPCTIATTEGESFAPLIYPYTYTATHKVDGRPMSSFAKVTSTFSLPKLKTSNNLKIGADWRYDKNWGEGQQFDQLAPLYPGVTSRPRKYYDIPSEQSLGAFAEEKVSAKMGKNTLDVEAGVRAASMLNLSENYAMHGKFYGDPRLNASWTFPAAKIARRKTIFTLAGGYGWHTKFPTIDQLYPEKAYIDIVEMNYWHTERAYRGIYTQTYIEDATNYELKPARNKKWEVRADILCAGNRLTVTYFEEDMTSGFRTMYTYKSYAYKNYDKSVIDADALTSVPDPSTLPYEETNELRAYSQTQNGSRTYKRGIEYTFTTVRFPVINTRLTINGAYFKTTYHNSMDVTEVPTSVVYGERSHYAGVYADDDGYIKEANNTNFTFDTDVPSIKMGFSLSAQCLWQTASQNMTKNNVPKAYIDRYGVMHEYTEEDAKDVVLQYLVRNYNASLYERETVPFCMNLNLKATKKLLQDRLMLALFVNKLFDAHPSYNRNGYTIRRYVTPYFGVEMNVKL